MNIYRMNNDGCVSNQHIEIPALDLLDELQVLFHHLKKDLNIPFFATDANNFGIGRLISVNNSANQSFLRRFRANTILAGEPVLRAMVVDDSTLARPRRLVIFW